MKVEDFLYLMTLKDSCRFLMTDDSLLISKYFSTDFCAVFFHRFSQRIFDGFFHRFFHQFFNWFFCLFFHRWWLMMTYDDYSDHDTIHDQQLWYMINRLSWQWLMFIVHDKHSFIPMINSCDKWSTVFHGNNQCLSYMINSLSYNDRCWSCMNCYEWYCS